MFLVFLSIDTCSFPLFSIPRLPLFHMLSSEHLSSCSIFNLISIAHSRTSLPSLSFLLMFLVFILDFFYLLFNNFFLLLYVQSTIQGSFLYFCWLFPISFNLNSSFLLLFFLHCNNWFFHLASFELPSLTDVFWSTWLPQASTGWVGSTVPCICRA